MTQFDRVYALADHMKAKPEQQFPQKKCSLLIPPGSRQAVTNGVIKMPRQSILITVFYSIGVTLCHFMIECLPRV